MKEALVINPRLFMGGGGDLICLHAIHALLAIGYHVSLFCDVIDISQIETQFGMGETISRCRQIPLFLEDIKASPCAPPVPRFPGFDALQRLRYAKKAIRRLEETNPDIILHTQPSVHFLPGRHVFQFVYDLNYLKLFDFYYGAYELPKEKWKRPYFLLLQKYRDTIIEKPPTRHFLALSRGILDGLKEKGFNDSTLVLPPCRNAFRPMKKREQVVVVTRVVPEKRLEVFCRVARSLPDYRFVIVGRASPLHPAYKEALFSKAPHNLVYVESPIRLRPELLCESKVYLHCGNERGFGIAIAEGLSAGCVPVCFSGGDGAEVVRESGVGYTFDSVEGAVQRVKDALKSDRPTPQEISQTARMFSPEIFENRIKALVTR